MRVEVFMFKGHRAFFWDRFSVWDFGCEHNRFLCHGFFSVLFLDSLNVRSNLILVGFLGGFTKNQFV